MKGRSAMKRHGRSSTSVRRMNGPSRKRLPAAGPLRRFISAGVDNGMIIVAGSGDNDWSDGGPTPANVDFPASSPYVIGCGGTTRNKAPKDGEPIEKVWNANPGDPDGEGTGGGFSEFFPIPI